jgi:hypothetical protein
MTTVRSESVRGIGCRSPVALGLDGTELSDLISVVVERHISATVASK